jgi:hypothetical protein
MPSYSGPTSFISSTCLSALTILAKLVKLNGLCKSLSLNKATFYSSATLNSRLVTKVREIKVDPFEGSNLGVREQRIDHLAEIGEEFGVWIGVD